MLYKPENYKRNIHHSWNIEIIPHDFPNPETNTYNANDDACDLMKETLVIADSRKRSSINDFPSLKQITKHNYRSMKDQNNTTCEAN